MVFLSEKSFVFRKTFNRFTTIKIYFSARVLNLFLFFYITMRINVDWKPLLLLGFLILSVSAQVSQEAAGTTASSLIPSGANENYIVQPNIFSFNGNNYWLVGLYSGNSNSTPNILVAVNYESGSIVNDNSILQDLYNLFFEENSFNSFNSNPTYSSFSSSNLNSLSTSLLNNVSASQQALQQVEGLNPQINFFNVSNYLQNIYNYASILNSDSINFLQTQSELNQTQTISDVTFNMTYSSYGNMLNDYYNVIVAINAFDNALTPIANNLSYSNTSSGLMSKIYYIYPSVPNPQSFQLILNYYNNIPTLSNASASQAVSNFESRVVEIQALNEFSNIKSQLSLISSSSTISVLQSKGFNFTKLAADYNQLVVLMNSKSAYPLAISLMSQISNEIQQAQSLLSVPVVPVNQPSPVLSTSSLYEFIGLAVILIIAYYAYLKYKKSQKSEDDEKT